MSGDLPSSSPVQLRVVYVYSDALAHVSSQLPSNPNRSRILHQLITSIGLLEEDKSDEQSDDEADIGGDQIMIKKSLVIRKAKIVRPLKIGRREIGRAHDLDYVDALLNFNTTSNGRSQIDDQSDSESESSSSSSDSPPAAKRQKPNPPSRKIRRLEKFNLTDDSPPFINLDQYVLQVAGASLAAVKEVADGRADVGICWDGGRHHALRSGASGFCYVNDPVLCVLSLASRGLPVQPPKPTSPPLTNFPKPEQAPTRTRKPRILYLDLDIHHGDGPAQAFQTFSSARSRPPAVVTLSVHHASPGFFPPGPLSALTQPDTKSPHTLSIPLKAGASGRSMKSVWEGSIESIKKAWEPDYVVVCLGVDGLAGDPKGVWNLGLQEEGGLKWCVDRTLDWNIPIVLLGGGGYNHANAARAYASFTAAALGRRLSADTLIQDDAFTHDEDYCLFEPQFDMEVHLGNMRDENTAEYLAEINSTFQVLAERIKSSREYQIAS